MDDRELINDYVRLFSLHRFLNEHLREHLSVFRYGMYETVFYEEARAPYFFLLVEGELRCAHYQANGTLAVVAMMRPFCALGDVEFLGDEKTTTAVIAVEPTVLLGIPSEIVRLYGAEDPAFLQFIIRELVNKINDTTSLRLGHLLPVKSRLALYLASQSPVTDNLCILPTKEELASLLVTTPRHLNRVFRELREEGIIGDGYPGVRIKRWEELNKLIGK